jgi:chromatin segregation and condensation protein Rec8/ScpA/Scc1 (kleisin family)
VAEPGTKPFFLYPPWNILFEVHRLEKLSPWNVDVSFLLLSFLSEMNKRGEVDFRASGVALDSSAFIYLMKSKLLLKLEEPIAKPKKLLEFVPPALTIPIRYELTSTTIKDLLEVLDEVLKTERLLPLQPHLEPILPPPPDVLPQIDLYLMAIEEQMEVLYDSLVERAKEGSPFRFSVLIGGSERLEAIKTFIILLFLAQRGKVLLWQDAESDEIYLTLGDNSFEPNRTAIYN